MGALRTVDFTELCRLDYRQAKTLLDSFGGDETSTVILLEHPEGLFLQLEGAEEDGVIDLLKTGEGDPEDED